VTTGQGARAAGADDLLDAWGRRILHGYDYRYVALVIVVLWLVFLGTRRFRYGSWPPLADQLTIVISLFGLWGVVIQAVVFLMTKPPAIEVLGQTDLVLVSIVSLIAVAAVLVPVVARLFLPMEVSPRPLDSVAPPDKAPSSPISNTS
jgi:hypothetical protein